MAIAITQHTDSLFKIDGVPYAKVYEVEISSKKVNLKNTGNRKTVRLGNFKNITIDGASYTDIIEFRDTLSTFVFKKGGGSGEGLQGSSFWNSTLNEVTPDFRYKGGLNGTDWQINRYDRADNLAKTSATVSNNGGYTTLTDAWSGRLTINYI